MKTLEGKAAHLDRAPEGSLAGKIRKEPNKESLD
jgi:hypothetical protein